jgi:hypothetical protein
MNLPDYLNTLTTVERREFATKCGITDEYLAQLKCRTDGNKHRHPSLKLCKKFIEHSGGKLTLEKLRPDIWAGDSAAESAPQVSAA